MQRVIVELDEAVADARDVARAFEQVEIVARRRQAAGASERVADIAHDVPAFAAAVILELVDGVVRVLQVRAVEHHQDRQQPLIRLLSDEGVLLPGPFAVIRQRGLIQPEAAARFDMPAGRVAQRERWQVVDRRLVVADRREHARQDDFDRSFVAAADVVPRRLLDVPLPARRVAHHHAGVDAAAGLRPQEGVFGVRVGRAPRAPRAVEQVAGRHIDRFPQVRQRRRRYVRYGRPHRRRASQRAGSKKGQEDCTPDRLPEKHDRSPYGANGIVASCRRTRGSRSGSLVLTFRRQPCAPCARSRRASVVVSLCRRTPAP